MLFFPLVLIRALMMGLMTVPRAALDEAEHAVGSVWMTVQSEME